MPLNALIIKLITPNCQPCKVSYINPLCRNEQLPPLPPPTSALATPRAHCRRASAEPVPREEPQDQGPEQPPGNKAVNCSCC